MRKKAVLLIAGILIAGFLPVSVGAQSLDLASFIDFLQKQVASLQEQIEKLKHEFLTIEERESFIRLEDVADIDRFEAFLFRGTKGRDVTNLQNFLALFPDIYPERVVSGYFGTLTEQAVKRFQKKYNIDQFGIVGPQTRSQLNFLLSLYKAPIVPDASAPAASALTPEREPPESSGIVSESVSTASSSSFTLLPKPEYNVSALVERIHELVNAERAAMDLGPLQWDWALAQVTFLHSADQARDNAELTDPAKYCHYPLIRHEGFTFGFTLKDRLEHQNISYRKAAENIGILPASKDLVYQFTKGENPPQCVSVEMFEPGEGTKEERTAFYERVFARSLDASRNAQRVQWVNRAWFTEEEIAQRIVQGWMGSPGHRANILDGSYIAGGIGVVEANDYFLITQNFVYR